MDEHPDKVLGNLVEQPFFTILGDVLSEFRSALEADDNESRHARSVVVNSVVLVEAAANAMLEALVNPADRKAADRQPLLKKLELCVRAKADVRLDSKRHEYQAMAELIRIRNQLVHPRSKEHVEFMKETERRGREVFMDMGAGERSEILNIGASMMFWGKNDASGALWAAAAFLRYVIAEVMGYTPSEAQSLLASRIVAVGIEPGESAAEFTWIPRMPEPIEYAAAYRCDFRFLYVISEDGTATRELH